MRHHNPSGNPAQGTFVSHSAKVDTVIAFRLIGTTSISHPQGPSHPRALHTPPQKPSGLSMRPGADTGIPLDVILGYFELRICCSWNCLFLLRGPGLFPECHSFYPSVALHGTCSQSPYRLVFSPCRSIIRLNSRVPLFAMSRTTPSSWFRWAFSSRALGAFLPLRQRVACFPVDSAL